MGSVFQLLFKLKSHTFRVSHATCPCVQSYKYSVPSALTSMELSIRDQCYTVTAVKDKNVVFLFIAWYFCKQSNTSDLSVCNLTGNNKVLQTSSKENEKKDGYMIDR